MAQVALERLEASRLKLRLEEPPLVVFTSHRAATYIGQMKGIIVSRSHHPLIPTNPPSKNPDPVSILNKGSSRWQEEKLLLWVNEQQASHSRMKWAPHPPTCIRCGNGFNCRCSARCWLFRFSHRARCAFSDTTSQVDGTSGNIVSQCSHPFMSIL